MSWIDEEEEGCEEDGDDDAADLVDPRDAALIASTETRTKKTGSTALGVEDEDDDAVDDALLCDPPNGLVRGEGEGAALKTGEIPITVPRRQKEEEELVDEMDEEVEFAKVCIDDDGGGDSEEDEGRSHDSGRRTTSSTWASTDVTSEDKDVDADEE